MSKAKDVIRLIDSASERFEGAVSASEKLMFNEVMALVKVLEVDANGNLKPTVANLKALTSLRKRIDKVANNKHYVAAVKELIKSFDNVKRSQIEYFNTVESDFKPSSKYAVMQKLAAENVARGLTDAGLQANVTDKLHDMLLRAVTSGVRYADLTDELHEYLTTTDKGSGALSRYANTYATTAISRYAGSNNKLMTEDLGLEWYEYVGSNIETTREFCDHLTEKRYIHKSEISAILRGEIDEHKCELNPKTGLPKGMIEGTNEENFQVNCGGWNCRHQLVPVASAAVPKSVKERVAAALYARGRLDKYKELSQ